MNQFLILYTYIHIYWAFQVSLVVKNPSAMQEI